MDTTPAGIPPLGGMVLTSAKPSPNVLVPMIRPTDDGEDPVLAHWQYELGKTVAFTSGYWPVWGESWSRWPKFAKLWAQIVRWTMRQESPANFETLTQIEGSRGRVVIDALDKDASYLNFLDLQARVVGPDSKSIPLRFTQTDQGIMRRTSTRSRPVSTSPASSLRAGTAARHDPHGVVAAFFSGVSRLSAERGPAAPGG